MKNFRRFALTTTVATYFLIFMGGLVRVSGAGMGCPDWPKCFGRWAPPTNVSQLPPDMDPTLFNFTLAWIEYFNRLTGVAVGLLITITMILAVKNYRKVPRVLIPAVAAFLLTLYQAWQGGQIVASFLEPYLVSVHAVLALIIVSLLIYATQQAYYIDYPKADEGAVYPKSTRLWVAILWIVGIIQVILGTHVRASLEIAQRQAPDLARSATLAAINKINYLHIILGVLLIAYTWHVGYAILKRSQNLSGLVKESAWAMIILMIVQLAIGMALIFIGIPALMQLFHLWVASIYVGVLLVLFVAFRRRGGEAYAV